MGGGPPHSAAPRSLAPPPLLTLPLLPLLQRQHALLLLVESPSLELLVPTASVPEAVSMQQLQPALRFRPTLLLGIAKLLLALAALLLLELPPLPLQLVDGPGAQVPSGARLARSRSVI